MSSETWTSPRGNVVTVAANGQMHVIPPGDAHADNRRPTEGRVTLATFLRPRSLDGKHGGDVRTVRVPAQARQYAPVTPYFRLNEARRTELQAEAAALRAKLGTPGVDPVVRTRLQQDLRKIEHELGMDASRTPDLRLFQEKRPSK